MACIAQMSLSIRSCLGERMKLAACPQAVLQSVSIQGLPLCNLSPFRLAESILTGHSFAFVHLMQTRQAVCLRLQDWLLLQVNNQQQPAQESEEAPSGPGFSAQDHHPTEAQGSSNAQSIAHQSLPVQGQHQRAAQFLTPLPESLPLSSALGGDSDKFSDNDHSHTRRLSPLRLMKLNAQGAMSQPSESAHPHPRRIPPLMLLNIQA